MTDKIQKIREEVEKRYEYWREKESNSHSIESEIRMSECQHLLLMLDSLQEEPVSIWHDANQQPTMYRKYLVRYSDGRISGSWERHDDGFIPWKYVVKEHGFTHWCYVEDLIKL